MLKFYGYKKCSTCRNAQKELEAKGLEYKEFDITTTPPSQALLKKALSSGYTIKDLFNKSGVQYRELNMKEKLPKMSDKEALALLSSNGKLVKRPITTDGTKVTVGYKDEFKKAWS